MFLDERGAGTQTTRNYGLGLRGERVRKHAEQSFDTVTMLTQCGLPSPMTIESPTGNVFLGYLEQAYARN